MKRLKSVVSGAVWTLVGLFLLMMVLLHVPSVQHFVGTQVGLALEKKLGTKVQIGRVDLGFLNRLVIDDVLLYDQAQKKMLEATRLSAKVEVLPLLSDGRISISSAQIFGLKAHLYRKTADSPANFQFVLDSLASKDTTSHTPLDLHIQSLVIRNGSVSYDQLDAPRTTGLFNTNHLDFSNLSAHINLYALTDDSLSLNVKKLSFKESSGLDVKSLTFAADAGRQNASIKDFHLQLPETHVRLEELTAQYQQKNGAWDAASTSYNLRINESAITPCDLSCFEPRLKNFKNYVSLEANATGNTRDVAVPHLRISSSTGSIGFKGNGRVAGLDGTPQWNAHVEDLKLSAEGIQFVAKNLNGERIRVPDELVRLGNIRFKGDASGQGNAFSTRGDLRTDAGNARLDVALSGNTFKGDVNTDGFNLARVLNDPHLGQVAAHIKAEGTLQQREKPIPFSQLAAQGHVGRFDYNGYSYRDIDIDGLYAQHTFSGKAAVNDPNGQIDVNGLLSLSDKMPTVDLTAHVRHFNPQAMRLTSELGNRTFDFDAKADFTGSSLRYANGFLDVDNLAVTDKNGQYRLSHLLVNTGYQDEEHFIDLQSDFGNVLIRGQYDYETLPQSFISLVANRIPTLPGLPKSTSQGTNDFAMIANIHDASLAQSLLGIPLTLHQPIHMRGSLNDRTHEVEMDIDAPSFTYDGNRFRQAHVYVTTQNDTLVTKAQVSKAADDGRLLTIDLSAQAADNKLSTSLLWDTHNDTPLRGVLNAETEFFKNEQGQDAAHMRIHPSEIWVDNTKWEVQPSDIVYAKDRLNIDHFQISNNKQHLIVSGLATKNPEDSLTVDLQDIDVAYVLDLVDFHSVDFAGFASGQAIVRDVMGTPEAQAALTVRDFRFQDGRMGTLHARADYHLDEGQINIDAIADDLPVGQTIINGYVSPKKNYIDLGIRAEGTRLEFVESFCGSFMNHVEAQATGSCRVFGDLSNINLEGKLVADGKLHLKTLNTDYALRNDSITMIPDEIIFQRDTVYDRDNHIGIVTGALHHKHLTRLTYDIGVEAQNLLAYDFHDYGDDVFYGTVYGTGTCDIKGRSGEITFDIDATPNEGSFIEYNAAGPEGISNAEFIQWRDMTEARDEAPETRDAALRTSHPISRSEAPPLADIPADIRLNFLVNVTPDFTLRVLMDEETGDKIALNGSGGIRANYFNKGSFDMFGNYLIDHGTYTMTIQNVIKKVFQFQNGSSIVFGGDPFNAALNLKGQYTIPAVSLSDLQMGRSFTQNNIRVNCLMNIEGTAGAPSVSFGLDMPTLSSDAQQMVRSVINSEEDMNQQVLYLLALGRFMPQGSNNSTQEGTQQSQTSLAMQSLLSGTLSQQINTVLSNVVNSSNWNFGANISTGDEGFNNAEYEGLLSGRLLNNRLLINGEFGYRDNVNTQQSSFIGDFDVQYLLYPNGNLAIKVYNETNDRYFTRNSLNTQGIGLIMKKDFTTLKDLLTKKKKQGGRPSKKKNPQLK